MIQVARRLLAALFFAAVSVHAAPLSPDPTGFWYNAAESGWGVNIAQQGDVLFVTLVVYDEQKRAQWFVASDVRDARGDGIFSGALYRTTGPAFGGAFDPGQVRVQPVGTVSLFYMASEFPGQQRSMQISYSVDGVAVTKVVSRLTWNSNATRLPGAYFAGIDVALAPLPQPAGCAGVSFFPPGSQIRINMSAPDSIFLILSEGIDTATIFGGQYVQSGQLGTITGGIFRGPIPNQFKMADAQVTNLIVSDDGFAGHVRVVMSGCTYEGSIGGLRRQ